MLNNYCFNNYIALVILKFNLLFTMSYNRDFTFKY
ncbi:hypothetical protein SAMN05421821_105314 [Mucilaginibacter lappiensis]|uniref:Uncharacterized protein n=1 Tax=Mucilaginibacter lappiensis TaxID=354630 RepID=A0A1N6YXB4_9SPHI|nr:hypothetical protein [Mucilaginibacter lappiensis]MBB6131200.1 hypothetical protein [Mucilaginibacter lappiensis]SIR19230.1 hypothetical protein SAMN05421821_105314 [Mucilaginibacter lappiensis]